MFNVTSQPFVNPNEVTFVRRHAVLQALHAAVIILLVEQRKSQEKKVRCGFCPQILNNI